MKNFCTKEQLSFKINPDYFLIGCSLTHTHTYTRQRMDQQYLRCTEMHIVAGVNLQVQVLLVTVLMYRYICACMCVACPAGYTSDIKCVVSDIVDYTVHHRPFIDHIMRDKEGDNGLTARLISVMCAALSLI